MTWRHHWVALLAWVAVSGSAWGGAKPSAPSVPDPVKKIHPSLRNVSTEVVAVVRFNERPLLARLGRNAKNVGPRLTESQQSAYVNRLRARQSTTVAQVVAAGGATLGQFTKALNAVVVQIPGHRLLDLARRPSVFSINPVSDYRLDLTDSLGAVGDAAVQSSGRTGQGIRVAVIDTGVDYTHRNLGGIGTTAAYGSAYGAGFDDPLNTTRDGLFPTSKVAGGWDFVGEYWPVLRDGESVPSLTPDEDPIDRQGHGTHVADVLAGASLDGLHRGVAPGATLYAFKACSSRELACSGVALLKALEACLTPDQPDAVDGIIDPATTVVDNPVDIINISLGTRYGQFQDEAAYMVEWLTYFGITVVCSGGNRGDLPYSVSSPGIAPGAISVAQTQMPSAKAQSIRIFRNSNRVTSTIINTASIDWAPVTGLISGPLVYLGQGCVSDPYPVPDASVRNAIAVIDRGGCNVSLKVDRAARLGAKAVIVVNNEPGDPPTFSQGAGSVFVPTLVVTQAEGDALKATLGSGVNRAAIGPAIATSLAGSMVDTSSRGPSISFQSIKPEIAAPGALMSAEVGTGTSESAFAGTSGSTPVVAGAAALVQEAMLEETGDLLESWALKAALMNNADPGVLLNPVSRPGVLAPVMLAGSGELRIPAALATPAVVAVAAPTLPYEDRQASLSFGYRAFTGTTPVTLTKRLQVYSLTSEPRTYSVSGGFRDPVDESLGAVTLRFSSPTVEVDAFGVGTVDVTLEVDPSRLPVWNLDGGSGGGDGEAFRLQEFDGTVTLTSGSTRLGLPWHLLPRRAADLEVGDSALVLAGSPATVALSNIGGAIAGVSEIFPLGGTSPQDYVKPDEFGRGEAFPDLKAVGVRRAGTSVEVAIATHEERSHPAYPAEFNVYLDVDLDGAEDYVLANAMLNLENGDPTGEMEVQVFEVQWTASGSSFQRIGSGVADSDFNSAICIFSVDAALVGLADSGLLNWYVIAFDNYFTGAATDSIPATLDYLADDLDLPRYSVQGSQTRTVPAGTTTSLTVEEVPGGAVASPTQGGVLFLHRNAKPGRWSDVLGISVNVPQ
ncbi:MAG: S8 family serine peptidase [Verrucomicrobiota bacterium]